MADWFLSEEDFQSIVEFAAKHELKKVGLQFPNELVQHAVAIALRLQDLKPDTQFAILADSPFGGCCIDEVAGQHYAVDGLVHVGSSCLSQVTASVPVHFVFGSARLDVEALRSALTALTAQGPVLLFYDFVFSERVREAATDANVLLTWPHLGGEGTRCCGRLLPGLADLSSASLAPFALLYVGRRDLALSNVLFSVNHCRAYHLFDAASSELEELDRTRQLRRRLLLIAKAEAAQRVGLLVSTHGARSRYVPAVQRLEALVRAGGKRCYALHIGKLTPTKLQNFPNIDCFVMVGCQQNSLFDIRGQEDFNLFQPIVSPYEMEQALKPSEERNWNMDFVTDLHQLSLEAQAEQEEESRALVSANRIVAERPEGGAVSALPMRAVEEGHTWFGLDPSVGRSPVLPPTRGRSGIAIAYEEEPS